MTASTQKFPRDTAGLPAATATEVVELGDGDRFELRIAPVDEADRRRDGADARLQRLDPRPDAAGAPRARRSSSTSQRGRPRGDGALARPAARQPLRRHARDPGRRSPSAGASPARVAFPDPGVYWYHPHIREDYGQEMGLYGNIIVEPADPDYWPPVQPRVRVTLDDVLIEDGQIAPFSPDETTYVAMGRFGNVMLDRRRDRARARRAARRGRAPLLDEHRQHARVQGRAARARG